MLSSRVETDLTERDLPETDVSESNVPLESSHTAAARRGQPHRLTWPFPAALMALWYAWLASLWWRCSHAQLTQMVAEAGLPGEPLTSAGAVATATVGKLFSLLLEVGFYRAWWNRGSDRLPFWRFFSWIAAYSFCDLLGWELAQLASRDPERWSVWLAPIAGLGLTPGSPFHADPALRAGFGALGALTLLRIVLTARTQAQVLGRSIVSPLLLTTAAWVLGRTALWWGVDLMRGMSKLP